MASGRNREHFADTFSELGRKRAAEWWRKRARAPEQQGEKPGEESAEGAASFSAIGDAFARLAEEKRSLLWLREVKGQSYAELAEILQIPVGTVKSRLFAAREELRHIWHSSGNAARSKE